MLGRKRVFLWPPKDHPGLYPYPHIHPSYQQSQVNFDDPDHLLFPDFSRSVPLEMVLEPGDVAYLPPYWWHRIETISDSVGLSLSIVSPSAEESRLAEAYWTPLPFGGAAISKSTDPEARGVAVQTFLVHLISRLDLVPRRFSRKLLRSRFTPLFPDSSLGLLRDESSSSGLGALEGGGCLAQDEGRQAKLRGKLPKKAIIRSSEEVARLLRVQELQSTGIAEVWLGDYAEELIRWAVGSMGVPTFLRRCLDVERLPLEALEPLPEEVEGPSVLHIGPEDLQAAAEEAAGTSTSSSERKEAARKRYQERKKKKGDEGRGH